MSDVSPEEKFVGIFFLTLMAAVVISLIISIGTVRGLQKQIQSMKSEAVQRGYAEFRPDGENEPKFAWKEALGK